MPGTLKNCSAKRRFDRFSDLADHLRIHAGECDPHRRRRNERIADLRRDGRGTRSRPFEGCQRWCHRAWAPLALGASVACPDRKGDRYYFECRLQRSLLSCPTIPNPISDSFASFSRGFRLISLHARHQAPICLRGQARTRLMKRHFVLVPRTTRTFA